MRRKYLSLLLAAFLVLSSMGNVCVAAEDRSSQEKLEVSQTEVDAENVNEDNENVKSSDVDDYNEAEEDNSIFEESVPDNTEHNAITDSEKEMPTSESETKSELESGSDTEEKDAENMQELVENSWRYTNGVLTFPEISLFSNYTNAWGKEDNYFVNDKGEKIEDAVAKGIDVSYHQGIIDWEKVKASDVDFVIIRCGYGGNYTSQDDKQWERNVSECERLGIPYGVYIYSYAMNVEAAKSEADHVLRLLKGHNPDYPVYYDLENEKAPYDQSKLGAKTLGDMAEAFCSKIVDAGYKVGVYANKNWFTNILTDKRFDKWDRWVAQYNSYCTYEGDYAIWQATSQGKIPGISGAVDVNFEIATWSVNGISTDLQSPQIMKKSISLSADVSGNTNDLEYKFVWQKDNWKEWGVIQNFSEKKTAIWTPTSGGNYTLYVDVRDRNDKVITMTTQYKIQNWCHAGISVDLASPQAKNISITLNAKTEGNQTGLKYKYVWMKDDWKEWGVIREFSENSIASWTPKTAGNYTIYLDISDAENVMETRTINYTILDKDWQYLGVKTESDYAYEVGKEFEIIPQIKTLAGNGTGSRVEYKYVWMKDGWKEWGVIKDFSTTSSIKWIPDNTGEYSIYVDIRDKYGNMETKIASIKITSGTWNYNGVSFAVSSPQIVNTKIKVSPQISGNSYGLQYKYVWMKDDWKEWGVIQQFSSKASAIWEPFETGEYTIYVDVMDLEGNIITKTKSFQIIGKNWSYKSISMSPSTTQELGKTVKITPNVSWIGEKGNLEYKYVWMKNGWEEWGVIKQFSSSNSIEWKPEELGTYEIYVDIKDEFGNMETIHVPYQITQGSWKYESLNLTESNGILSISPNVTGNKYGLQYKYVWMQDDWKEWGVIKQFSESTSVNWKPKQKGTYWIYVDLQDQSGKVVTLKKRIDVK